MDASPSSEEARAAAALPALTAAARRGGATALAYFRLGRPTSASVAYKAGDSPVTAADLAADKALAELLRPAFPEAGWLSEESEDGAERLGKTQLLIVDPIDGTRAFMRGDPCWTVAVALIERGAPVAGVVYAPALEETFAASRGGGASLNGAPIRAARLASLDGATVAGPRGLVSALAANAGFRPAPGPRTPSLAYRLASVAAGRIAIGAAGAEAHDWDIAAADVILRESDAALRENGAEVRYNQPRTRHDRLLAAPLEWLARLTAAFGAPESRA